MELFKNVSVTDTVGYRRESSSVSPPILADLSFWMPIKTITWYSCCWLHIIYVVRQPCSILEWLVFLLCLDALLPTGLMLQMQYSKFYITFQINLLQWFLILFTQFSFHTNTTYKTQLTNKTCCCCVASWKCENIVCSGTFLLTPKSNHK